MRPEAEAQLRKFANVVGTMVSTKKVKGQDTGQRCVAVLVRRKLVGGISISPGNFALAGWTGGPDDIP